MPSLSKPGENVLFEAELAETVSNTNALNGLTIVSTYEPLPYRFTASAVTLFRFAGGEFLPLPASKGLAFPFLLT